jgi:phosphotransferase system HPr (HPr) family protein
MNGEPLRSKVVLHNMLGLHMRPASWFVGMVGKFKSAVFVGKGDRAPVDGRSILSLISLGAEQGTELTLEVSGPDQQEAMNALVELVASFIKEDEEEEWSPPFLASGGS